MGRSGVGKAPGHVPSHPTSLAGQVPRAPISGASHSTEGPEEESLTRQLWRKRALVPQHSVREPRAGVRVPQPRPKVRKQQRGPGPWKPLRALVCPARNLSLAQDPPPCSRLRTTGGLGPLPERLSPSPWRGDPGSGRPFPNHPAVLRGRPCFISPLPCGLMLTPDTLIIAGPDSEEWYRR